MNKSEFIWSFSYFSLDSNFTLFFCFVVGLSELRRYRCHQRQLQLVNMEQMINILLWLTFVTNMLQLFAETKFSSILDVPSETVSFVWRLICKFGSVKNATSVCQRSIIWLGRCKCHPKDTCGTVLGLRALKGTRSRMLAFICGAGLRQRDLVTNRARKTVFPIKNKRTTIRQRSQQLTLMVNTAFLQYLRFKIYL